VFLSLSDGECSEDVDDAKERSAQVALNRCDLLRASITFFFPCADYKKVTRDEEFT